MHRLVSEIASIECTEAGVLSGPGGLVLPHGTAARARAPEGRLDVEASGGAIRGAGTAPSEASAVLKSTVRLISDGPGERLVRVTLEVRYAFTGYGSAGVDARLRTVTPAQGEGDHVRARLEHRGLSGVRLATVERRGRVSGPASGHYPSRGSFTMVSVVSFRGPASSVVLRGDLGAHSLGNLGSLDPVSASTARASASFSIAAPCGVRALTGDGRPLRESSGGAHVGTVPGVDASACSHVLRFPDYEVD